MITDHQPYCLYAWLVLLLSNNQNILPIMTCQFFNELDYDVKAILRIPYWCLLISCLSGMASRDNLGPVVQSIVSLTSSLRGQLVKCFMTL